MTRATGAEHNRQSQELTIFHDVAKALTSSLDLDSILQTIMEKMAEYFRPDTWSLLMVDEVQDELYFAIAVGDAAEALKNVRLKMGEGIAGWVAKHGEHVISADVENDPRFAKRIDETTQWETRSVIYVPLRSRLRVTKTALPARVRWIIRTCCASFSCDKDNPQVKEPAKQRTEMRVFRVYRCLTKESHFRTQPGCSLRKSSVALALGVLVTKVRCSGDEAAL